MRGEHENVRRLAANLRENLARCVDDPDEDPVHDTRTGTRRLQVTLETLVRELPHDGGEPVCAAATALMRVLRKIRHAAAPVRDLDVHRRLLSRLTKRALGEKGRHEEEQPNQQHPSLVDEPDVLETAAAGLRSSGLEAQADDLDAWLKHRRTEVAGAMQAQAPDLLAKLDRRVAELVTAMRDHPRRARKKPPGVVALDNFARLASEMQHLDAGNLHEFRKGAKQARYLAELATRGDAHAARISEALKNLQDEIGDWHDWVVLAEEAHAALGDTAQELTALLEGQRDEHFVMAMKTAARLRGRLMGEWLAVSSGNGRARPAARSRRATA